MEWVSFGAKTALLALTLFLSSCSTGAPKMFTIDGVTRVHTPKKVLGMTYRTVVEEMKTKEQKLDDLDIEKKKNKMNSLERQKAAAFWIGLSLMVLAPVCVVIGYLSSGWKFWGTMSAISAGLGAAFWGFESLIPYLKWGVGGMACSIVLWTMWKLKDFSLIERLKESNPGEILGKGGKS